MAEHWEYKTLALAPTETGLVPSLEDGKEVPYVPFTDHLNQLALAGWEIQTVIPASEHNIFPTLILRRLAE